jgi:hypothetical protein
MPCRPAAWPIPLFYCKDLYGNGTVYACVVGDGLCYICVNDEDRKTPHPVQNDHCSE